MELNNGAQFIKGVEGDSTSPYYTAKYDKAEIIVSTASLTSSSPYASRVDDTSWPFTK